MGLLFIPTPSLVNQNKLPNKETMPMKKVFTKRQMSIVVKMFEGIWFLSSLTLMIKKNPKSY